MNSHPRKPISQGRIHPAAALLTLAQDMIAVSLGPPRWSRS